MENDLERSMRLLEEALSPQGRSIFKPFTSKTTSLNKSYDLRSTLPPPEIRSLFQQKGDNSFYNKSLSEVLTEKIATGSVVQTIQPWKTTVDNLFMEFFEVLQSHFSEPDVLEVILDLARLCSDSLKVIDGLKSKISLKTVDDEVWLQNEANTWRLLFILYQDRLNVQVNAANQNLGIYSGTSEKLCIENLFKRDSLIRESQLVIDWLESIAGERDNENLHYADKTCGWENTLHQLTSPATIVFKSSRPIVDHLDPDAQTHLNRPLHDLDMENEQQLHECIFCKIRRGKLQEAQKLCNDSGHYWRGAMYEGWRLYHNPQLEFDTIAVEKYDETTAYTLFAKIENESIEGNANRDSWKISAWHFCEQEKLSVYEKASVAAYCGCLNALLPVCKTWEDYLWAFMRVVVDIRVETEIRSSIINRNYLELPDEYWNQKMSLNEIFFMLENSSNSLVKKHSQQREYIIQKHLILDEMQTLVEKLVIWTKEPNVTSQFIRFAVHLVLFLEHIGQTYNRGDVEQILENYICRLMEMQQTQLVAFYVGRMDPLKQVNIYASYLEKIVDNTERKEALYYGEESDLNTRHITIKVVENIRNKFSEFNDFGDLQHKMTELDKFKIAALDWMLFYEDQKIDALKQTNALIFSFLALGKIDAAQLAFNKIPSNTVQIIVSEEEVNSEVNQIIKEHLSYKTYLDAQDAFNSWFKQHNSKPLPQENVSENAPFTEKVAHQHRLAQYKADLERWKMTTLHLAKTAKSLFYNVLLFPEGGWLQGAKDCEYLRSKCIPEVVLLLYVVLFESGSYNECIELADVVADEKYCLYKVYQKEQLEEILTKLCETSVTLLNSKKDPWGVDVSV